ncbi:MAG: bifunctional ornithine acetyltransferase/N-acetylglutamate synthase, partial [bacterium]
MKKLNKGITAPKGFQAAGLAAGIKKSGKPDMSLIYSEVPATAAAVFTSNQVKAAPVLLSKEIVRKGKVQAIITNAGNANCWTGERGLSDAITMVNETAKALGLSPQNVLVASTGTIGNPLPMPKIKKGIRLIAKKLSVSGGEDAARAILTTDKTLKQIAVKVGKVTIAGIAKGSGMIEPGMGTMLGYITTDAKIDQKVLQKILQQAVNKSFNMISVDNCMSTNDTVFALANGLAGKPDLREFAKSFEFVCEYLAKEIARDGEGATKL